MTSKNFNGLFLETTVILDFNETNFFLTLVFRWFLMSQNTEGWYPAICTKIPAPNRAQDSNDSALALRFAVHQFRLRFSPKISTGTTNY